MKSPLFVLSALALSTFSPCSIAWNYQGHVTVAQIAYQNLDKDVRQKVDAFTKKAYQSLPEHILEKMNQLEGASQFARLAMVPDLIRKMPASDVWLTMGERIPDRLKHWDDKTTGAWHYINQAYPASSTCGFTVQPNIKLVNDALYASFKNNPQAASMMFLSHLAGDSHQPMHAVTKSTSSLLCLSDFGANKHRLDVPQKDLHHLWDSGLGFLDQPLNIDVVATELQAEFPKSDSFEQSDVSLWLRESYQLADFAYSVEKGSTPSDVYMERGTEYVKQRLVEAGYRLAGEQSSAL
ncbi:endonuclease [Veronia nyctiphanis]|uniref:Endonuclease n=1 Tax=Veronia nyctiphanis TaxID=1278244 RepID=A0A4Q0YQ40_9GAMM|nr:S1/P1 nuclease [Veronia nyctiphanis]RXJ71151.1 endonuclease [Veronia nyctiphanis]